MQWQWWNGSSWVMIGIAGSGYSEETNLGSPGEPEYSTTPASLTIAQFTHGNSANATNQRYRLVGWLNAATRAHSVSGSCNAQG
jgi:hypothetical protein